MKSVAFETLGAAKSCEISLSEQSLAQGFGIETPLDEQGVFSAAPTPILTPIELAQFWSRVKVGLPFECWPWQGRTNDKGYGRYKETMAHRIACELVNGAIPDDEIVRHSCDNPPCCNPKHLLPGTHQDNSDDAVARGRIAYGEASGKTKLTSDQVAYIRENPDRLGGVALATRFGVCKSTISYVRNRRSWKYG